LSEEQVPLTESDEFVGEPGLSAPLHEVDYAHRKPACDVLLNGSAYAPGGKEVQSVTVAATVGRMRKSFEVVGDRVWRPSVLGTSPSTPVPFAVMPISYGNAFGGADTTKADKNEIRTFVRNPVGRGYSHFMERMDGKPLPNTQEAGNPVQQLGRQYPPMSFGPIGRNWQPRAGWAGTYDQTWMDERAPFWPDDFDYRYFQAAPSDQQIPYPSGGEEVILQNLTPDGEVRFELPRRSFPILVIPHNGRDRRVETVLDTVLLEPDAGRFLLTWRASLAMNRSCFDIKQIIVGNGAEALARVRRARGKPYYRSLAELARARKGLA
jgi:hypothetical protein